jgi:hypothetical protein
MSPKKFALMLLVTAAFPVSQAAAGPWTFGPNIGFALLSQPGSDPSLGTIGIPSGGGGLLFGSVQPGMRIGYVTTSGRFDIYTDLGLSYLKQESENLHTIQSTINLQFNFSTDGATTAYGTGGLGVTKVGGSFLTSETDTMYGLGFGIRHQISEGHGAIRTELRFDRLEVGDGQEGLNSVALKFGIDLWTTTL